MQSKKYKLFLAIVLFISGSTFAQQNSSGYSVFDSSVVPAKGKVQQREFMAHTNNFPAKPRDMWEVGVSGGQFTVVSDVSSVMPTFGFSAHVRKSLGYAFSLRLQYMNGTAKGLNWNGATNFGKNTALTSNGYVANKDIVFYNYKNKTQDLGLQGIISLNNIKFHQNKSKVVFYFGAGIGASAYETKINAANEANGTNYAQLFNETYLKYYTTGYGSRKDVIKALKAGMDGTYEQAAQSHGDSRAQLGNQTLVFSSTVLGGVAYKISKRINIALEDRHTFVHDDLLDGQYWQEHASGDAALSPNFDTYNYLSLGLNVNLGSKSVEPLWWINPLDYVYGEVNNPKHMNLPKPKFDDADGDGIIDQLDREQNTPAGASVDSHGVARDTDGDGIPDFKDKQMVTPTECLPVDANGVGKCPEPECCKNAKANAGGTEVTCPSDFPSLSFKGNSAALSSDAKAMLASVASKLKANPTCTVTINGYPEASKASQAVCQQRTDAVKAHLVQTGGISADRISTNCEIGGGDKNTIDIKSN